MVTAIGMRGLWLAGASVTALMLAAPAFANDAAGAADAAAAPGKAVETIQEVVVTAEKRSVNIQQVPVAVTAFTSKERALIGINSVQDMTNFTPGLTYSSQLDRPVMRGLARTTNIYLADSSVGVYDNDLFTNSTFLVGRDDMIVDQVEVLLGPQNTLYGRNSIGGVINTQSRRPSDTFGGEVRAAVGNYEYSKFEATITGPTFLPNTNFRLSGYNVEQDEGYFKNLSGKSFGEVHHDPYVELQLEHKTDKDDIWFMAYDLSFNSDRGGPGALLGIPAVGPYDTQLVGSNSLFYNPQAGYGQSVVPGSTVAAPGGTNGVNPSTTDNRTVSTAVPMSVKVRAAFSLNFHWTHHFDGWDLKYVGGYSQYHYSLSSPSQLNQPSDVASYKLPSASPLLGNLTVYPEQGFTFDTRTKWYSNELVASSTTNNKLSWIAGVYHFDETDDNPETEFANQQPQLAGGTFNVINLGTLYTALSNYPSIAGTRTGATDAFLGNLFNGFYPNNTASGGAAIYNPNQNHQFLLLDYQSHVNTLAGFLQTDYKFNDVFKLTTGIRYSYDLKSAHEESRYIFFSDVAPSYLFGAGTPGVDLTPFLISNAQQRGVGSAVSYPSTGKFAGDAVRYLRDHSSALTGTISLDWTPDSNTLGYVRYSRGYKALALNAGYVGNYVEAKPEHVDDYELGLKKTLFDKKLTVDVAAFYYDYTNDQLQLGQPVVYTLGTTTLNQFINIPKAVADGIEVTANWTPINRLHFSLTYGYNHTEITTGCNNTGLITSANAGCFIDPADPLALAPGAQPRGTAVANYSSYSTALPYGIANLGTIPGALTKTPEVPQSVKGNPLPQAPENKVAFNANYTFEFEPGNLTLSGSYIWKDVSYSSIFKRAYDSAPAWDQVDLRATWTANHGNYEIVAYVKNLFDSVGYDAASGANITNQAFGTTPGSAPAYTQQRTYDITPPRLVGAEIHYHF